MEVHLMTTIHLTQHLDSETLHVPQLRPLIGKDVEIIIRELPSADLQAPDHWKELENLAGKGLFDPAVVEEYRQFDAGSLRTDSP
jgi:hypothetical protein